MTRCCPVCKTEDVLWNSLEDKFCICLKCDATGVSVERAKPCMVKVTRAEPATPSSDEVARAFSTLERYDTFHQYHTGYDSSAEIKTIRDHIAALEADVLRLNGDCSNYLLVKMELEADNKRLREALVYSRDFIAREMGVAPDECLGGKAYIIDDALAQTDGKAGE